MGTLKHYNNASLGVVLKNTSTVYAYAVTYKATLYDSQGAQVEKIFLSRLGVLPGQTVVVGNAYSADTTPVTPVRFTVTPVTDRTEADTPCAFAVKNVPPPVPSANGVWTASGLGGMVTGSLQVPAERHALIAEAFLYDAGGQLVGFGRTEDLTTAQGATPVRIPVSGLAETPNPWGPVSRATITGYDDLEVMQRNGSLGECQQPM